MNRRTLDKVKAAGCPVLVWTVDLLGGSNRELSRRSQGRKSYNRPLCQSCHNHKPGYERPMHRGVSGPPGPRPAFDWDYVKRLTDHTGMKIVLKGIVTSEEAELAVEQGVDGVFVSNHGGRAENSRRGTIDSLPDVVAGVKGRVPVLVDGGVRRGADIFKALIAMLLAEFAMVMRQARTATIDQIGPGFVAPGNMPIMMRDNRQGFGL